MNGCSGFFFFFSFFGEVGDDEGYPRFYLGCNVCNKYQTLVLAGLLQPLLILQKVWNEISMDCIMSLLIGSTRYW